MSRKFARHENAPPKYQGLSYRVKAEHVNELQIALEEDDFRINQKADTSAVHGMVVDEVASSETVTDAAASAVTGEIATRDLVEGSDPRAPRLSVEPDYSFVVADSDGNASWMAVTPDGGVPRHSARSIRSSALPELEEGINQISYAVSDSAGRASWIAVNDDGSIPDHSVTILREAIGQDVPGPRGAALFEADDAIHEWWILSPFTWLGDRLVATLYGANTADIRCIEWVPGIGITVDVVVANSTTIDDHNAPGHWAAQGERAVLVWSRHNTNHILYVQVSLPGPDMASFADTPIIEMDSGTDEISYGSPIRITHLSDDTQNTFWTPVRWGDSTQEWRFVTFSVNKATGAVTQGDTLPLVKVMAGQFYCSFASAHNGDNQTLRIAAAYNPAMFGNSVWYLELDCATGDLSSPFDETISHNVYTALDSLEVRGNTYYEQVVTPALTHSDTVDRRLFYVSAGPYRPRIAYAEWDADDPDSAIYKVLDVASNTVTDYGPAGTRFGYTGEANYLSGMCFDSPAHDDTVYLARHPLTGTNTIERHWTKRGERASKVLLDADGTTPIRPIGAENGGPLLFYFDLETYGVGGPFRSTGVSRSVLNR